MVAASCLPGAHSRSSRMSVRFSFQGPRQRAHRCVGVANHIRCVSAVNLFFVAGLAFFSPLPSDWKFAGLAALRSAHLPLFEGVGLAGPEGREARLFLVYRRDSVKHVRGLFPRRALGIRSTQRRCPHVKERWAAKGYLQSVWWLAHRILWGEPGSPQPCPSWRCLAALFVSCEGRGTYLRTSGLQNKMVTGMFFLSQCPEIIRYLYMYVAYKIASARRPHQTGSSAYQR